MRRRVRIAVATVATGAAAAAAVVLAGGGQAAPPPPAAVPTGATATVERRDLSDRDSVSGLLGYADPGTLVAAAAGVITGLREPGSVVTRGHSLYDVNNKPAAFLLYGELPAWRDFGPGMTDGEDVRQLERNLRALGYDPGTVDDDWDSETTDAVQDFQGDRDLTDDGTLARGELVFRPGATRIGQAKAAVGDQARGPLAAVSSTERRVTVDLDARRQRIAHAGDTVTVELPTGRTARGRITNVGTVATKASEESEATIEVTIALAGRDARGTNLDQAPVDVGFVVEQRRGVLAVPVKALLARQGGGYAIEVVGGGFVTVDPGLYADDWVEVAGAGVREGLRVVTAE